MLANDSVTVAVEVPIWLTRPYIAALERHHGIRLLPEGAPTDQTITGHIDFLQVRNGAVYILDYKPDARTNRPFAQLTIYALALTRLAGLRLFDIKCAWFNQAVLRILSAYRARPYESRRGARGGGACRLSEARPD
jgi:ATP-dependent exoDNAse (exonuclease V) beta subunit